MRDEELLDIFAALALQGMCSGPLVQDKYERMAKVAYKIADAMMDERKRRNDEERTSC